MPLLLFYVLTIMLLVLSIAFNLSMLQLYARYSAVYQSTLVLLKLNIGLTVVTIILEIALRVRCQVRVLRSTHDPPLHTSLSDHARSDHESTERVIRIGHWVLAAVVVGNMVALETWFFVSDITSDRASKANFLDDCSVAFGVALIAMFVLMSAAIAYLLQQLRS